MSEDEKEFSLREGAESGAAAGSDRIEGRNAVIEAFRAGRPVDKLFVQKGLEDGPIRTIVREAKKQDTIYFSKRVNRSNDPGGKIPQYSFVDSLDYEVELGVVIGKDAFGVSREEALSYVLGYTIVNDVSARNVQRKHSQWFLGKSLDGYTPMGPCIVTSDEIGDIHNLDISCYVNDEKRQGSNTSFMITTVEEAIAELSQGMTLKAGTIIATGTPGGVAMGMNPPKFLNKGDIVRCEISGIGQLVNIVG